MDYLHQAIDGMAHLEEIDVVKTSAIYETQPLEVTDQEKFLNMIAEVKTTLEPTQLLKSLKKLEKKLGRKKRRAKGPREIDIDIVFYGQAVMDEPDLTIPHEKFHQRKFVLFPLRHLAPEFRSPREEKTVTELLHECPDKSYIHLHGHLKNA